MSEPGRAALDQHFTDDWRQARASGRSGRPSPRTVRRLTPFGCRPRWRPGPEGVHASTSARPAARPRRRVAVVPQTDAPAACRRRVPRRDARRAVLVTPRAAAGPVDTDALVAELLSGGCAQRSTYTPSRCRRPPLWSAPGLLLTRTSAAACRGACGAAFAVAADQLAAFSRERAHRTWSGGTRAPGGDYASAGMSDQPTSCSPVRTRLRPWGVDTKPLDGPAPRLT